QTWTQSAVGGAYTVTDLVVLPGDPETVLAAAGSSFRSTDAGETWDGPGTWARLLARDAASPQTVYAIAGWDALFKSTDRGATWAPLPSVLPAPLRTYLNAIASHPSGALFVIDAA